MTPAQLAEILIRPRKRRPPVGSADAHVTSGGREVVMHLRGRPNAPGRVLLVHGWEADHRDLLMIAEKLPAESFCVLPDLPAHGLSPGETLMIPEGAVALGVIDAEYGPFDLCVAHSVGAAIAQFAASGGGLRTRALVMLAPPAHYARQLSKAAQAAGAPPPLITAALDVLRKRCPDLDRVDSVALAPLVKVPCLIVVAGSDRTIDPDDGRAIAAASPNAVRLELPQATHRSLLSDEAVHEAVAAFARDRALASK